jgi:transcriptional regulator with XRE-family HTH domain
MTLKNLRKNVKLHQHEVAEKLNCTIQQISNYERGKRGMPLDKAAKLAEIYGVTIDEIFRAFMEGREQRARCG